MKRVAIVQSNYIPWKGYFDLIASVDEFVLYDDVQFTKNDWRNRNLIKTSTGIKWLTIPVSQGMKQRICDVRVTDTRWRVKHWKTIATSYARAPFFPSTRSKFEQLFNSATHQRLSDVNRHFLVGICQMLGIQTVLRDVREFSIGHDRTGRLVEICQQCGASTYLTGPSARAYLDVDKFRNSGIDVEFFEYAGYPEYPQIGGEFQHNVSTIDLILNCGPESTNWTKVNR